MLAAPVIAGAAGLPSARAADAALSVTLNGVPVDVANTLQSEGYDETNHSYTECFSNGSSETVTLSGWSVATLLAAAGTTADKTTSVSVARAVTSGSVVLTPADYDPSAPGYPTFPDGPALVVPNRSGADLAYSYDFFRPYRSPSCASDPNGPDYVQTPTGDALSIAIASGTMLDVSASEDRTSATTGEAVDFTGSVSNPPPGEALAYRWDFSDGSVSSGMSVSHSFAAAGTYTATLSVSSGADAGGTAPPLTISVGSAPVASPAPGGGTTRSPAPKHSVSQPRASGTTIPSASAAVTFATAGASAPVPIVPTPRVSSTGSPGAVTGVSAPPSTAAQHPVSPSPGPTEVTAGQQVSGLLVGALSRQPASPPVAVVSPTLLAESLDSAGAGASSGGVPLGASGAALGAVALLGLGAGYELRRFRARASP